MKNYLNVTKILAIFIAFTFVVSLSVNAQEANPDSAPTDPDSTVVTEEKQAPAEPAEEAEEAEEASDEAAKSDDEQGVEEGQDVQDVEESSEEKSETPEEPTPTVAEVQSFEDLSAVEEKEVVLEATTVEPVAIGYCHVPQDNGNNPNEIYIYHDGLGGWDGGHHNKNDEKKYHVGDYLIYDQEGIDSCSEPVLEPNPDTISLKVCKIIVDENGEIITGEGLNADFSVEITKPDNTTENVIFSTELILTDDLVDDNDNDLDAQCTILEGLATGEYKYSAEQISGDGKWEEPLYHDYFNGEPTLISDFLTLTIDGEEGDNDNVDGVMNLGKNNTRKLVILNTLEETPELPPVDNICLIPSADGDTDNDDLSKNGEIDFQEILDDNYTGVDKVDDQLQIQTWSCDSDKLKLDVKFVGKYADHGKVFGYYIDSNISSFTPIFRKGSTDGSYASTTEGVVGDTYTAEINDASIKEIGFAIKSWAGSKYNTYATENSLNPSGADKVVAYNPEPDTYLLGFEDLGGKSHIDFNDLVVEVNATCLDDEEEEYPYGIITYPVNDGDVVSGTTTLMAEYHDGDDDNDDEVQWAVRFETCSASTGTVLGNVDEYNDVATWDGKDFSFEFDADLLDAGDYCFVFNPTDDGPVDVREERWFTVRDGGDPVLEPVTVDLWGNEADDRYITIKKGESVTLNWTSENAKVCDAYPSEFRNGFDYLQTGSATGTVVVTPTENTQYEIECYNDYYETTPIDPDRFGNDFVTILVEGDDSPILGCTDPSANNYNSSATQNDQSSCTYDQVKNNGGGSSSSGGSSGSRRRSTSAGEVLGATTENSCGMYLFDYMRQDLQNDQFEVLKLQAFLMLRGFNVQLNGVFDKATDTAVRAFQSNLNTQILIPWALYDLSDGVTPTGYVYKTTRYTINNIVCPGSEAFPMLP